MIQIPRFDVALEPLPGMDRMVQRNVLAMSGRAVEAAGDVGVCADDDTLTGTLTSATINGGVALSRARPGGLAASLGGSQAIEAHSDLAALSRSTQAFAPRPGLSFNHGSVSSK
jgi:K+-transporting ATPase ATPase B chain